MVRDGYHGGYGADFSNISQEMPAVSVMAGFGKEWIGHTPEAVKFTASQKAHEVLINATKVVAMTAYDLLADPELFRKCKEEFDSYKSKDFAQIPSWHMEA